ncbi:MAG: hypothetical protein HY332_23660 [Chloroflexi bacterium]|nr:hypothetical protein [Chloroflexota bacterium]
MAIERLSMIQAETRREMADSQARVDQRFAELAAAQKQTRREMADSQARVDQRFAELAATQKQTRREMADSQAHVDQRFAELAAAQARTERALGLLAKQVGGLSETVGGDIEDIAYIVLHDALKREFGWEVGPLERTWQRWNGAVEEVDIFGEAVDPARPGHRIWIVGEAKHNLTASEVDRFIQKVRRARRHLVGEIFPVCFCYRARPEVQQKVTGAGLYLVFSYNKLVRPPSV